MNCRSHVVFASICFFAANTTSAATKNPVTPECLTPIIQSVKIPEEMKSSFPIKELKMTFEVQQFKLSNKEWWLVKPTIHALRDAQVEIDKAKAEIPESVRKRAGNSIDVGEFSYGNPQVSDSSVILNGDFKAEKWWKMTGFCCSGFFDCHACEWKTRVFSRRVHFSAAIAQILNVPAVPSISLSNTHPSVSPGGQATELTFKSGGSSEDDRNALEQVYDLFAGVLEAVDRLFNGSNQIQFGDFLGVASDVRQTGAIDPQKFLSDRLSRFGYSPTLHANRNTKEEDAGDNWEIFNSALKFDRTKTGFRAQSTVLHEIQYAMDLDEYLDSVVRTRQSNMLDGVWFCDSGGTRESLQNEYLPKLARKFEGADEKSGTVEVNSSSQLRTELERFYLTGGAEEFYSPRFRKIRGRGRELVEVNLLSAQELSNRKGMMPGRGSLWNLAREQGWTAAEYACARRTARKRSGSADKVFPFQDFSECLRAESENYALDAWERVDSVLKGKTLLPTSAFVQPLNGEIQYRGWYYCFRNPSLCSGADKVMWIPSQSPFGARGGSHKGMDLIDEGGDENISVTAVVGGQLIYHGKNLQGWGHALLLPFLHNAKRYIAVYAHLPSSAQKLDGVAVNLGDSLGLAGCSGNAGDGNSKCNNYCLVNGVKASDVHLHFELLRDDGAAKIAIDPSSLLGFKVATKGLQKLYTCGSRGARH